MGFFSAIGGLIGGIFGRNSERKAAQKQRAFAREERDTSREAYLADRGNERRYMAKQTAADRRYDARRVASDRKYVEQLTAKDRRYAEKMLFGDRDYARKVTLEDRAYADRVYRADRRRAAADKALDRRVYQRDRGNLQRLADRQAERTAASRGIDFARLRDDAQKAGFNPLTAMQWASAYDTTKGYGVMGDAYSGSASPASRVLPGTTTAAGGGGGGGTPVIQSPSAGSSYAPSSGFQTSGGGYGSSGLPAFASSELGSSLGELIDTGLNWFNHKDDAKYEAIADQVARGQLAREYERQTPRAFGYSLSKVEPFRPSIAVSAPPLRGVGFDLVHNRPTEVNPVQNTPVTATYDVGAGAPIRGLNTDLDPSEVAQMANEVYVGARAAGQWAEKYFGGYGGVGGIVPLRFPKRTPPAVPRGTGSYSLTGSYPRAPSLRSAYSQGMAW